MTTNCAMFKPTPLDTRLCMNCGRRHIADVGEPWACFDANSYIFTNDHTIVAADVHDAARRAHIVACVNACKGINPKSVPLMFDALRAMLAHEGERTTDGIGIEHDSEALAKAKSLACSAVVTAVNA